MRVIILKYLFVKGLATPPPEYISLCKERWNSDEWTKFLEGAQHQNAQQIDRLRRSALWNVMEKEERDFMQAGPLDVTQQARIRVAWHAESIVCLLWALGYISELLPYDEQANLELTNKLPVEPVDALIKKSALRPHALIDRQRDLAELWHWRSRTRQLQSAGNEAPLPGGMTIEKVLQQVSAKAAADGVIPSPIGDDLPAFGKAYRDLTDNEYLQATSIALERHHAFNWLCGFAPGNSWSETPTDT